MSEHDFDALADIQSVIEQAGGDVKDFETKEVSNDGPLAAMAAMMSGDRPSHHHYILEVCVSGPTTRDIPDPDAAVDGDDAMEAVTIALAWAEAEGMDKLAEDLDKIRHRIADQNAGDGHPADEMEAFDISQEEL